MSQLPQRIGTYQIQRQIGQGIAQVYLARHPAHGQVALKLLPPSYIQQREAEGRFRREARLLKGMRHPNILRLYDAGTWRGKTDGHYYFIATEYLPDGSLYDLLLRYQGHLSEHHALQLAIQIADALAYAHDRGIVHRDLKPSNILLRGDQVVLGDFGIARALDEGTISQGQRIVGTLAYMSPEQTWGDPQLIGRGSDMYSFGVMLYEMLSGHQPRNNPDLHDVAVIQMIQGVPLPLLLQIAPHVSPEVAEIVHTCLQAQRKQRYESMSLVAAQLRRAMARRGYPLPEPGPGVSVPSHRDRPRMPWLLIGISSAVVLTIFVAAVVLVIQFYTRP